MIGYQSVQYWQDRFSRYNDCRVNVESSENEFQKGSVWRDSGKPKKVQFKRMVDVVLIPTIEEIKICGLYDDFWWQKEDYPKMQTEAVLEAKRYIHFKIKKEFWWQSKEFTCVRKDLVKMQKVVDRILFIKNFSRRWEI